MIERTVAAVAKGLLRASTAVGAVLAYLQLFLLSLVVLAVLVLAGILIWQWIA